MWVGVEGMKEGRREERGEMAGEKSIYTSSQIKVDV